MRSTRARVVRAPLPTSPLPPLPRQSGHVSRAERAYAAEMEAVDAELSNQVAGVVARLQSTLDGLEPRPTAGGQPSLAALQAGRAAAAAVDATALSGINHSLAAVSESVQRVMLKVTELRGTLEALPAAS